MPLYIAVLGIDGSGKSTLAASLPVLLAAESSALAAGVGEDFRVIGPAEDHLAPRFHPDGLPLAAQFAKVFRKLSKRFADNRAVYPAFKIPQMMFVDRASRKLGRHYEAEVVVTDGNAVLTAGGRASNYRRPASDHAAAKPPAPSVEDLKHMLAYITDGASLPPESRDVLPSLGAARKLALVSQQMGFDTVVLPDVVLFLDLNPSIALERVRSRGQKVDRHENVDDLAQARTMYLKTLEAFALYRRDPNAVHVLNVDSRSPGDVCRQAIEILRAQILARRTNHDEPARPLGTTATELSGVSFWSKVFNFNYLVRYMTFKFFRGAWREPLFFFSDMGRLFLKEGYSAGVMRVIYDRDEMPCGFFDKVFLEYGLHRAVYDRLQILTRHIQELLEKRLGREGEVRIFTAPSGFAYDVFRPLESFVKRTPEIAKRITLVACDLDPHGVLKDELAARAAKLGIAFQFLRGNIMDEALRAQIAASGPFDMALFVGLSSWLPKPATVKHLTWLRGLMRADAVLVTDCFTPDAYALSGRYVGYKANYYTPDIYKVLLDYCGYDGLRPSVESGRDAINHVLVAGMK